MKYSLLFILLSLLIVVLFILILTVGPVEINLSEVCDILLGKVSSDSTSYIILHESRIPMAVTAFLAGASLSVAGLLLQTVFQNPLAGPSILGISSGSSLGAAVTILCGSMVFSSSATHFAGYFGMIIGAFLGATVVILVLLVFSGILKNAMALLIVGVMISYLASSLISFLNYFAPAENVRSFVVWGLGSFTGVSESMIPLFVIIVIIAIGITLFFIKPLDALLLSERYAENMGYNMRKLRSMLVISSGLLTASVTAFCGPIGFIGLVVPHISRMIFKTSRHNVLLPATILSGGVVSLLCAFICVVISDKGVLPINVITPVIGVPVILYIMIFRKKLRYFN